MFLSPAVRPLCIVFVAIATAPLSAQELDWGKRMFDKHELRFGSVAKNADVVFKLQVKNVFKEEIRVSNLSTSCGCISWQEKAPLTIPSGQTVELSIRLDTVRHSGDKNVTAYVSLTEPTRGSSTSLSIPVQGRIRQDVVLQTNNLNFGQVDLGKPLEIRMNVNYSGGRPDWAITAAKVNNPHLTTKIVEKSRSSGTASYDVVVTLDGSTPASKLHDRMLILSNESGDSGYAVTVDAQVEADIVVVDAQFGQVVPGASKTVNAVVRGKKPFKIEKVTRAKEDDSFKVKTNDHLSHVHAIPVTFTPGVEHGLFEEEFILTISGREQQVTFKAKGRVMDQSVTVAKPVTTP